MFFHYHEKLFNCQQNHQANIIEPLGQPNIIHIYIYIFNEYCPHQHDSKKIGVKMMYLDFIL